MRKNYCSRSLYLAIVSLLLSVTLSGQTYTNGVFVLNEGGAGNNNASVSFINGSVPSVAANIYAAVNPSQGPLGDIAQSMAFNNGYAYIVLNFSNSIKVVNQSTFEYVATISGLENPRYIAFHNGKGYVTNWGSGGPQDSYVAIVDLQTNQVTGTIPAAEGVERIITHNNKLYIAHQGGFGYGNTISVINPETHSVEATIPVGDVPNKMIVKNNLLYVMCGGKPMWAPTETSGSLVTVNLATNTVAATWPYPNLHPANLDFDENGNLYFTSDADIFKAPLANPAGITEIASLSAQGAYGIYGMNVIDNKLYVADAGDYVSPGTAFIFSTEGLLQTSYVVGVIPNSFYKAAGSLLAPSPQRQQVALYPNPATERFFLNTSKNPAVAIYDVSGKEVLHATYSHSGVSVSALPAGIYTVRIADDSVADVIKLVIR